MTNTTTALKIQTAFHALVADLGVPLEMVNVTEGNGWTRHELDLPDGTELHAYDDDLRVVVLIRDGGSELSRVALDNVTDALLLAVLSAIVTESLKG